MISYTLRAEKSSSKDGKAKEEEGENKPKHNLANSRSDLSIGSLTGWRASLTQARPPRFATHKTSEQRQSPQGALCLRGASSEARGSASNRLDGIV